MIASNSSRGLRPRALSRAAMAAEIGTSRAQLTHFLDPDASNVTLDT